METTPAARFEGGKCISLTTYRKDGTEVPAAVWFAVDGDALVVWTGTDTGKVKRIRRRADVTIALCDMRGRVKGEAVPAAAEICDGEATENVRRLIKKRYGISGWLLVTLSKMRRGADATVGLRVTFPA